jgi:hypothetical protein
MSATPSEATHADYLVTIKRTNPGYWRCRRALSGPADRFDDRTTHDRGHGCTEPARVPALAGEILARTTARFRGSCWSDTHCDLLAKARSLEHTETARSTAPKTRWLRLEDQPSATAFYLRPARTRRLVRLLAVRRAGRDRRGAQCGMSSCRNSSHEAAKSDTGSVA